MRFMMMVKHAENSGRPPKELIDAMTKLTEEAVKSGTMLGGGGLAPTAQSTRVRLSNGKVTVTDGPYTEAKEVIAGFAIFDVKSKAEAIDWGKRFLQVAGDGTSEMRELVDGQPR